MSKSKEYFKLKNLKYFRNFFDTKEKSDTKNIPRRAKKVLGHFALNSENGVNTPSWRILGTKKYYPIFEQNKFCKFLMLRKLALRNFYI